MPTGNYTVKTIPGPIAVEPLDAVLKSVTFDASKLTLWPSGIFSVVKSCSCRGNHNPDLYDTEEQLCYVALFNLLHKLLHRDPYGP